MSSSDAPGAHASTRASRWLWASRSVALVAWVSLLLAFWLGARQSELGPVAYLISIIERLAAHPLAALGVLALYLARPLLLVPITVANLTAGFVLGPVNGWALALVGTLASASMGYAIGRFLGPRALVAGLLGRWRFLAALRRRSFESVVAGGLMYLHADAVNLPAGMLRVRYPVFLAGIAVGNALTMTSAVLAGASVEGDLASVGVTVDTGTVVLALTLFACSLAVASWLRRRQPRPQEAPSR